MDAKILEKKTDMNLFNESFRVINLATFRLNATSMLTSFKRGYNQEYLEYREFYSTYDVSYDCVTIGAHRSWVLPEWHGAGGITVAQKCS